MIKKVNFIDINKERLIESLPINSPLGQGVIVKVGIKDVPINIYENNEYTTLAETKHEEKPRHTIIVLRIGGSFNKNFKQAKLAYVVYPPEILNKLEYMSHIKIKFAFATNPHR